MKYTDLFEESIQSIQRFYETSNHTLGWRFLCSSKKSLNNPQVALITLNPGGNEIPDGHSWGSCENGSAYLTECWNVSSRPGQSSLQRQIQLMFERVIKLSGLNVNRDKFIERSLCGYFVPFRSPRLEDLQDKQQSFEFASILWSRLFKYISPRLFICIDVKTHKKLRPLLIDAYRLSLVKTQEYRTNWGNVTATLDELNGVSQMNLLRLPHLSTFKLFTSGKCQDQLDIIFREACRVIRS